MNKIKLATIVVFASNIVIADAQIFLQKLQYSGSVMVGPGFVAPSVSAFKYLSLSSKKQTRFRLGFGARLTSTYGNSSLFYTTAPAKLTTGKSGLGAFGAPFTFNTIDTVQIGATNAHALNVMVALNLKLSNKWSGEFNIDLAGFTAGGKQNITLLDNKDNPKPSSLKNAEPTSTNVLLVGDNDLGAINSEIAVVYKWTNNWQPRIGIGYLFNEYKSTLPTYNHYDGTVIANDRFRNKAFGINLGLNYTFTKKNYKVEKDF